jgi:serine/threonine protein kinase
MIHDVSEGLAWMNAKNMSHCDLKLENILYKMDATSVSGYRFLVADFGNVQYGKKMGYYHTIQTNHYRCGENLMKSKVISTCDMASLGCIIYECITGNYLVNHSSSSESLQLEAQFNAMGYDFILEQHLSMTHSVYKLATQLYFDGLIQQQGFIAMEQSQLQRAMKSLGYVYSKELTHMIQNMLLPIPNRRLQSHQVNSFDFIQSRNTPVYAMKRLIKSLGMNVDEVLKQCFE